MRADAADNRTHSGSRVAGPKQIEKLLKINSVLMTRVESSLDQQTNAFALFQTAVALENEVRSRTEELKAALDRLEQSNKELVAAREASERALRSQTGFFTAVGHDLLQPLHAARLTISTLAEIGSSADGENLLAQVDHALSTINELLNTLLEIARLDAGIVRPSVSRTSLSEIFSSLLSDLQPLARAKSLPLYFRETKLWIMSDPLMMRRIIQNLVVNAIRYTEAGGVRVSARPKGESVEVAVLDTGPGIHESERLNIFEEFQRGAASEQSTAPGLGLGLSIVRRMAESLDHQVSLWSRPGWGSCFKVIAPAAIAPATVLVPKQASEILTYGLASARIVVVENDEAVANAMRGLLARWGCESRLIVNLKEVDQLSDEPDFRPDIILADYHLDDGESGLTVVDRFRSIYGKHLPAVVITADPDLKTMENIQMAGCEFMRKPVKPAELRSLIAHILG